MAATIFVLDAERSKRPLSSWFHSSTRARVLPFPTKAVKRTEDEVALIRYGRAWFH
jgi:hypothetical protein